jgi:multisubunit Na+/H+ antiporter MnhB subunit
MGGGLLTSLLKMGGVTALTVGVFYLLYRQLLNLKIFKQLGSAQTLILVLTIAVLVWLTAMTALLRSGDGPFALNFGNHITNQQGGNQ